MAVLMDVFMGVFMAFAQKEANISFKMFFNPRNKKKRETLAVVRVRVELTTLALSAPRSADWANGPTAVAHVSK